MLRKELNGYPGLRAVVQELSQSGSTAQRERAISIFGNLAPGHSQGEAVARVEALGRDLQGRVARLRARRAGRSAPASTAHPATPQQSRRPPSTGGATGVAAPWRSSSASRAAADR